MTPSTSLLGKQALGLPLAPYDFLDEHELSFTKADLSLNGKFPVMNPSLYILGKLGSIDKSNQKPIHTCDESPLDKTLAMLKEFNVDLDEVITLFTDRRTFRNKNR